MKKFILSLATVALLFITIPSRANTDKTPITTPVNSTEVNILIHRLDEIKELDKSSLSRVDKKELREEVRAIEGELKRQGSSVSISVGAIIIILLLIILL